MVDTFITEVSQDTWIFFPWDLDVAYVPPISGATDRQGRHSCCTTLIHSPDGSLRLKRRWPNGSSVSG